MKSSANFNTYSQSMSAVFQYNSAYDRVGKCTKRLIEIKNSAALRAAGISSQTGASLKQGKWMRADPKAMLSELAVLGEEESSEDEFASSVE